MIILARRVVPTLLAGLLLALAGCASSGHSSAPGTSAPSTTSPSTTAPATTGPSAPITTTGSPTTSAPSAPRVPVCAVSSLSISVTSPLGSAGALHYQLVFKNESHSSCTLYGFPGVSFLDDQGHQIGPPAQERTGASRQVVTLVPGMDGYVTLDVTDPGIPPCAGPGTVTLLRVYPPGSYSSADVPPAAGMKVCTSPNTANYIASAVGPVTAAPSPGYNT